LFFIRPFYRAVATACVIYKKNLRATRLAPSEALRGALIYDLNLFALMIGQFDNALFLCSQARRSGYIGPYTAAHTQQETTMRNDEIKAIFDQQASSYDERWAKTAPIRDALYFLLEAVFSELPVNASILCIGTGTGEEIDYLARRFPRWTFVAVEPSGAMLDVCRSKAQKGGFASRCEFHEGYLESLAARDAFDAATCFLVSQFILEQAARADFFRAIAARLRPGGILASSDLASDTASSEYETLLNTWLNMMSAAGIPAAGLEQMRAAYARDVAILPRAQVASIIQSGGFDAPVTFYQAGLIHAWFSKRASG
jgi:tRNA (cmo5U34)-methyltransferase